MNIEIISVEAKDKQVLRNLLELYLYDFTEVYNDDVGPDGQFGYKYLDLYFSEKDRHAFFIKVDNNLAGFVMINKVGYIDPGSSNVMAEFFVMKKYRSQKVGRFVAKNIFDMFPCKWEVPEAQNNLRAQKFWRDVINEYTSGDFKEQMFNDEKWKGPVQYFENNLIINKNN